MKTNECGQIEPLLTQLYLGDLDAPTQASVRAHLAACEKCRDAAADIEQTVNALRTALNAAPSQSPALDQAHMAKIFSAARRTALIRRFRLWPAAAAAAAVIAAMGALFIGRSFRHHDAERGRQIAAEKPEVTERVAVLPAVRLPEPSVIAEPPDNRSEPDLREYVEHKVAVAPPVALPAPKPAIKDTEKTAFPQPDAAPPLSPSMVKTRHPPKLSEPAGTDRDGDTDLLAALPPGGTEAPAEAAEETTPQESPDCAVASARAAQAAASDEKQPAAAAKPRPATAAAAPPNPPPVRPAWPTVKTAGGTGFTETKSAPMSVFPLRSDYASYPVARQFISSGLLPPADLVRPEEIINYFSAEPKNSSLKALAVTAAAAPSPFKDGMHLLRIGVKARDPSPGARQPAVFTALVDTSPSMNTPEKIGMVRKALLALADRLRPDDKLAVIESGSAPVPENIEYIPIARKTRVISVVASLRTGGEHDLGAGIKTAAAAASRAFSPNADNRLLVFTDGAALAGRWASGEISQAMLASRRRGVEWTICAMNPDVYSPPPLAEFASKFGCDLAVLDREEEIKRLFAPDSPGLPDIAARDAGIGVEFDPEQISRYRLIGYESRPGAGGDANEARGGTKIEAGRSAVALYEVVFAGVPRGAIGTVRLSYIDARTNRREHTAMPLNADIVSARFDSAEKRFRLTAAAAQWAEMLAGREPARQDAFEKIASMLPPLASEPGQEAAVKELIGMIRKSSGLARAPGQ